jgi:hypothetical protein
LVILRARSFFARPGAHIFFIVSAGILSGDQNSRFRLLPGLGEPRVWLPANDAFRIHNVFLQVTVGDYPLEERTCYHVCRGDLATLFGGSSGESYVPYNYKTMRAENLAKRLVPLAGAEHMLPRGPNLYKGVFTRGADLTPRTFLCARVQLADREVTSVADQGEWLTWPAAYAIIHPNRSFQAKSLWEQPAYAQARVEGHYVYRVVKSTGLLPFAMFEHNLFFLPVETRDLQHSDEMAPLAATHHRILEDEYLDRIRDAAKLRSIMANIDYHSKLSNPKQLLRPKVVFTGIGSYLKAALVDSPCVVDTSLYYYTPATLDEAHYLLGVLNADCVSADLQLRGSTGAAGSLRNICKKGLDYAFRRFDPAIPTHQAISAHARAMRLAVQHIIEPFMVQWPDPAMVSPLVDAPSVANLIARVRDSLAREYKELDRLVLAEFQEYDSHAA